MPSSHAPEFAVLLRMSSLFGDLDPLVIDGLAKLCSTRMLATGETLFRKGDAGDAVYGIRRGQVGIEISTKAGSRVTLNTLGSGDVFGEIAMLDGRNRTADAVAMEKTELFALRREQVLAYIESEPRVALKFIELLCKRLRYVSGRMEEVVTLKLGARLARQLLTSGRGFRQRDRDFSGTARDACRRSPRDRQSPASALAQAGHAGNPAWRDRDQERGRTAGGSARSLIIVVSAVSTVRIGIPRLHVEAPVPPCRKVVGFVISLTTCITLLWQYSGTARYRRRLHRTGFRSGQ